MKITVQSSHRMTLRVARSALCAPLICVALIAISCPGPAPAQPARPGPADHPDWLLDPSPYKATIEADEAGQELVMSNGLVRRVWRLAPNVATVALDNLMTGESILRGVKPEALARIEGLELAVGGLTGQPNYAYLLPEWIDEMRADPTALQFDRYEIGATQAPFEWKRARRAADLPWPPPGVGLTLHFKAPTGLGERLAAQQIERSDLGREMLLADDFETLDDAWQVHRSSRGETTFSQEGKPGFLMGAANNAVYAERPLPEGVQVVQCMVNAGTDQSASWGPGIALVWPDRVIKFYIRPGDERYGVFDGAGERLLDSIETAVPHYLRLHVQDTQIACDASQDGQMWQRIHVIPLNEPIGSPIAVRLGKTSRTGQDDDHSDAGVEGRCVVGAFRAWGDLTEAARNLQAESIGFLNDLSVAIHYEMYDGLPLMGKWMTLHNGSDQPILLESFTSDLLAAVEVESQVENPPQWRYPNMHIETEYAFFGMDPRTANQAVHWVPDPQYATQVHYLRQAPLLLEVRPPLGPDVFIGPDETFSTFRSFTLVHDLTERGRQGLAVRRMYRTLAPWVTENPLLMHVRTANPDAVRLAIDQSAEVGFEMVILTFGSGFNIENESPEYLAHIRELVEYANDRGIELGGYSLLASRSLGPEHDVISPDGARPAFGHSPCLASAWGQEYFRKLYQFYEETGFNLLEHDGSYPGDLCASTEHPGHRGLNDSQWVQWKTITDFYKWCRGRGIYLNVPDHYFLTGSNKTGMGYRETNWSLPRAQQVIHTRQNIFDGTWEKTSTMGWMFVPLTQYHGGGAAATIEPLDQHRDHYRRMLFSNLGAGVQACYRGPRLYDTDRVRDLVKEAVDWFKEYRDILESDIIHVSSRRADGRDIDWMFNANAHLDHRGMLVVHNPLDHAVTREIPINLYYTGLTDTATIRVEGGEPQTLELDRHYVVQVPVTVEAEGFTWVLVEQTEE